MPSLVLAACALAAVSQQGASSMNIVELANSDPNLLFFATLLKSAGLTRTLSGPGPFTVLAPMNAAFDTYDVNSLLAPVNFEKLRKILGFHVVSGSLYPSNLTAGLVDSLEGLPLQVFVRGDQPWQLAGKYIGAPKSNPLDVSAALKLQGYEAASYINASNGVVYLVSGVLMPPNTTAPKIPKPAGEFSGCTKDSCIFKLTTQPKPGMSCCGQVDAAPRMPPSIFNDTVALAEYIRITEQLSLVFRGGLINQACTVVPSYKRNGTKTIDWSEGFKPWCEARCGCGGLLNPCKDVPDDPAKHTYCSLCGPKYNGPIEVQMYHNQPIDCTK